MKRLLVGVAVAAALVLAAIIGDAARQPKKQTKKYGAIVRLHDAATGRFFCSGVVVSAKYILTAAHCFIRQSPLPGLIPDEVVLDPIDVRTPEGKSTGVFAVPNRAGKTADLGLLVADLSDFEAAPIEKDTTKIHKSFMDASFKSCGFPYAGTLVCFEPSKPVKYMFMYGSLDGALFPGMSGGPVFSREGKVIAVNSATTIETNIYAPIVAIEAMLGVEL